MSRSWLALGAVIALIAVAVAVGVRSHWRATRTSEEPIPEPTDAAKATPEPDAKATLPVAKATQEPAEVAKAKEPPKEAPKIEPRPTDDILKEAQALIASGKPADAQKALSESLTGNRRADKPEPVKALLTRLNDDLLLSRKPCPQAVIYKVAPGDTLSRLARKHKTSLELIMQVNALTSDVLQVGQELKIIPGGFDVEVDKHQFRLTLFKDGLWVREFKVGLGKNGSTPVGEFVAGHKITKPVYFGDGAPIPFEDKKNNPLGTRWITIQGAGQGQYGIHGTWEPESMGKEESKGCVRMVNKDVEWLFAFIIPGESKVVIKP